MPGGRGGAEALLAMSPLAAIVRLAVPTTLVMAVAAASNVAFTYFVSRLGTDAIGAVSLVFPASLLATTAMAGGIGAGATSAVARALGAGRARDANAAAGHALALALAIGAGAAIASWLAARPVFRLMGADGTVLDGATLFAHVLFGGAAITFLGGMFDSVLRGEGNVRVPAIWSTVSLGGQILLTPVLMFGAGLGLLGAPLAMLGCQLVSTLARARWVFAGRGVVQPTLDRARGLAPTRAILGVGVPAALSASITNVGTMVLTGVLARLGEDDLAAYGLGTRLDFVLLSFAFGVGSAVLTLVGMAAGARRPERIRAVVVRAAAMITSFLVVPAVVLAWRPGWWIGLFSDDPGVHAVGAAYFRIVGPSWPCLGVSMVVAFAFQGLGRAGTPTAFMAARVAGVLGAAIAVTRGFGLGEHGVFAVIAAGNVVSAAGMLLLYLRLERRLARGT